MQPTTSAQALTGLQSAQTGAQDPNSILRTQQQQLGVNDAQQTVTGLRGAINNTTKLLNQVAPSVMGRTGGSLVTNAQASKQIQNEQAPISANLSQEGTDYNNANSDLTRLQGEAQTAASGIYAGQQDKLSYAQNLYNTLYQQEQDRQAEADKQAAFAEQVREANQTAARSGGSGFNLPNTSTSPKSSASTATSSNPNQAAYNDVKNLLTKDPARIQREYEAIKKSAKNGNTYDKAKQAFIEQLYPAAKNFGNNSVGLSQAIPTLVSLNPSYSGLSVGVVHPGTLR